MQNVEFQKCVIMPGFRKSGHICAVDNKCMPRLHVAWVQVITGLGFFLRLSHLSDSEAR